MPECIHGLEIPLCDACYPKTQPEKPAVVRRPAGRAPRLAGATSTTKKSVAPAQQRVYHVTHIRNLEVILETGEIAADATAVVDLSTDLTRELRRTATFTTDASTERSVSEYVPFYLAPSATRWDELRRGAEDETQWSAAARAAASVDFVVLVTTVAALGPDAVITDGDAAGSLTRFEGGDDLTRALSRLHDTQTLDAAEALALGAVPVESIQIIGVANDRVRDRVRELTGIKVAVYPPWFQPTEV